MIIACQSLNCEQLAPLLSSPPPSRKILDQPPVILMQFNNILHGTNDKISEEFLIFYFKCFSYVLDIINDVEQFFNEPGLSWGQ